MRRQLPEALLQLLTSWLDLPIKMYAKLERKEKELRHAEKYRTHLESLISNGHLDNKGIPLQEHKPVQPTAPAEDTDMN